MKSVRLVIIFWSAASGATQPALYLHSPISGPGRAPQPGWAPLLSVPLSTLPAALQHCMTLNQL